MEAIAGLGERKNITKRQAPCFYSMPPRVAVFWIREKKSLPRDSMWETRGVVIEEPKSR